MVEQQTMPQPTAPTSAPTPVPTLARPECSPARALAAVETELCSLPARAVRPPCLDLRYAARAALDAAHRLQTLHAQLAALPDFDLRPVLRLHLYAAAALHAEDLREAGRAFTSGVRGPSDHRPIVRSREGSRDPVDPVGLIDRIDPLDRCARAYTLLLTAYHHCQRGVTFLRWRHGDVEHFLPPLFAPRRPGPCPPSWAETPAYHPIARLPPSMVDTITAF